MYHKECKADEVYVGNHRVFDSLSSLDGKVRYRLGEQAYDFDGKKIPKNYMLPLILKKEDYHIYDDIKMKELKDIRAGK